MYSWMYKLENILSGFTLFQKLNKLTLNTSCGMSLPPATNTADKAVDEDKITNDKLILIFEKTFKREMYKRYSHLKDKPLFGRNLSLNFMCYQKYTW